jgi:hypothetical protein
MAITTTVRNLVTSRIAYPHVFELDNFRLGKKEAIQEASKWTDPTENTQ